MTFSLTQGLRRAALLRPRQIATSAGGVQRTWHEVLDRVARVAGALRAAGMADGDRVAVLALNSAAYFELLFAVPWAGGAIVPINTRLAAPEVKALLEDSGARFLFIDETFLPVLESLQAGPFALHGVVLIGASSHTDAAGAGLCRYEHLVNGTAPMPDRGHGGADLAGLYYTGGTTGRAKGVMLSHTNLVANALNVVVCVGYTRETVYLHAPPMFHLADGCSTFGVTLQGGRHVFTPRFDPLTFLQTVQAEGITHVTLVPTMLNMILHHARFAQFDLSSLERIYVGASPLPEAVLRKALELLPQCRFQQAWGMTELSPIGTTMPVGDTTLDDAGLVRLRSCGQPVPSVEIRIVDEHGNEVPRGSVGELIVRGPTVMQGYWNQPEATAAVLREGWLHSGDAASMDAEGYVTIVDRLKDMVITGGENVYSGEVESVISLLPGVAEVAVIGVPDDTWGEAVLAIVVARPDASLTEADVIAHCRARIAAFKCPRSVLLRTDPLPLSAAGKVLKKDLRAPFWVGRDRAIN